MSLQGLQNYTQPLTLLGEVTINGTLNAKNVYVSGTLTGAGISTNILGTDNTWTGTNDFQNTTTYTGSDAAVANEDMLTKKDIDDAVAAYNPLPQSQTWSLAPTFSNANPPVLATAGSSAPNNILTGYNDMVSIINASPNNITTNATNTFTGTNTFNAFVGVSTPQLLVPTNLQNPASKAYIDGKIEVAGKALTYTITTPGSYNFANANRGNIGKIDYWIFSGSCGGYSGAVVSGTIGNGCGLNGSLLLNIGTTADPTIGYTTQDGTLPSSTQLLVSNQVVASAFGACNLNGTIVPGIKGTTTYNSNMGISANGVLGNNVFAYSNILGTSTSAGGCVFVAYYI